MNQIKIFYTEKCPYCEKLMKNLDNDSIPYQKSDILGNGKEDYQKLYNHTKRDEIPCIIVGKQILIPGVAFKTIDDATLLIKQLMDKSNE